MYDSDAVAAAYARGLAAGVASTAYARGFAAGAAVGVGIPTVSGPNETAQAKAPRQRPTKEQRSAKVPLPCKWYERGTCKFGPECRYLHQGCTEQNLEDAGAAPLKNLSTEAVDSVPGASNRRINLEDALSQTSAIAQPESSEAVCMSAEEAALADASESQIFWCDQRAFKETSAAWKEQLESETQMSVKTYRTAEMCIRLLRKKRHWQTKSVARCFLVSWANAQSLVPFLSEQPPSLAAKVVILCDTCGNRGFNKADNWKRQYPLVECVATTWPQAVEAIKTWAASAPNS
jgi:hypothetical protein